MAHVCSLPYFAARGMGLRREARKSSPSSRASILSLSFTSGLLVDTTHVQSAGSVPTEDLGGTCRTMSDRLPRIVARRLDFSVKLSEMAPPPFTAREWAALFPALPPAADDGLAAKAADGSSEPSRLAQAEVLAALPNAALRASVRLFPVALRLFSPWRALVVWTSLPTTVVVSPTAALFAFARADFAGRAFGAAQVGVAVAALAAMSLSFFVAQRMDAFAAGAVAGNPASADDYAAHAIAGLVRWRQLCASEPQSALVLHVAGDADCPCPGCLRSVLRSAAAAYWVETAVKAAASIVSLFFVFYSPFVTFSHVFWPTWWCALLGIVGFVGMGWGPVTFIFGTHGQSVPVLEVAKKLHKRAMALALDVVAANLELPEDGMAGPRPPDGSAAEPERSIGAAAPRPPHGCTGPQGTLYAVLHDRLATAWRRRSAAVAYSVTRLVVHFLGLLFAAIISAAGASCIPAYVPLLALYLLLQLTAALVVLAVANSQIDAVVDLYVSTRTALRRIAASSLAVLPNLEAHDAQLAFFALTADRSRARFAGVPVGLGTARAVVATVVTVALGLWSLLKGAGLAVVADNVCPVV
ncbi:hypothetical protein DFJ74DRAFT_698003 [Hyaloraphidium curvatum]|nr:hypothetical protein DFJ74DRAFT_698003 [Hyaloraphidium curvatum]